MHKPYCSSHCSIFCPMMYMYMCAYTLYTLFFPCVLYFCQPDISIPFFVVVLNMYVIVYVRVYLHKRVELGGHIHCTMYKAPPFSPPPPIIECNSSGTCTCNSYHPSSVPLSLILAQFFSAPHHWTLQVHISPWRPISTLRCHQTPGKARRCKRTDHTYMTALLLQNNVHLVERICTCTVGILYLLVPLIK